MVDDLASRPVDAFGFINARPGPHDLCKEFISAFALEEKKIDVLEKYARVFAEFVDRRRQQDAEWKRVGVDVLNKQCDAAANAVCDVEGEFEKHLGQSVLAVGVVLMIAIKNGPEEIDGLNLASLAAIRPQLTGAIAEAADRALAQGEEAA